MEINIYKLLYLLLYFFTSIYLIFFKNNIKLFLSFNLIVYLSFFSSHLFGLFIYSNFEKFYFDYESENSVIGFIFTLPFLIYLSTKIFKINSETIIENLFGFIILTHIVGKIGCYYEGCCYGLYLNYQPYLIFNNLEFIPIQLIEIVIYLILGILYLIYFKRIKHNYNLIFNYILIYSVLRFIFEFFRGDKIFSITTYLSNVQIITLSFIIIIIIIKILKK